jgi:uncharacterized protein
MIRRTCSALALSALILVTGCSAVTASPDESASDESWQPGPKEYGISPSNDVFVPMSDGTELHLSVSYPTELDSTARAKGPFPVLLTQNPYIGNVASVEDQEYFVSRGYIYATADVRGTLESGGEFIMFGDREIQDGVELVDWAANGIEGSAGTVGLIGCSYLGLNQYLTAGRLGPDSPVKAMAAYGAGDMLRDDFTISGMPTGTVLNWLTALDESMGASSSGEYGDELAAKILAGDAEAYDGEYWQARDIPSTLSTIVQNDIPVLIGTGWDDIYSPTSLDSYAMLQNLAADRDPFGPFTADGQADPRYQVVVNDEGHCGGIRNANNLRWFDQWIKNDSTGLSDVTTPMHLQDQATGEWTEGSAYPAVDEYTVLRPTMSGALTAESDGASGTVDIDYPHSEKLSYTSTPFQDGALLNGPITLTIDASSTTSNSVFMAELYDVAEDGTTTRVTSGAAIASLRATDPQRTWRDSEGTVTRTFQTLTASEETEPGVAVTIEVRLAPRLHSVESGHSLQLVVYTQPDATACAEGLSVDPCGLTTPQQESVEGGRFTVDLAKTSLALPLQPLESSGNISRSWSD